jgi:hypothetical protein
MSWGRKNRHQNIARSRPIAEDGFGDIEFTWRDGGTPSSKFDKIAHSGKSELLMVSLFAETQRIKQIRAALVPSSSGKTKDRISITAGGVRTRRPGDPERMGNQPGRLTPSSEGYLCYQHKLGYGMAHAIFVSKAPGFMLVLSEPALWRELKSTRFTTPLLREWMPYIEAELRGINRLEDAHCYGCHCGLLTATTQKLDEIVVQGLSEGRVIIPKSEPAAVAV